MNTPSMALAALLVLVGERHTTFGTGGDACATHPKLPQCAGVLLLLVLER